jgi:hypothetical protein
MKKLILILGLVVPWTAFADVTFYDNLGNPVGSAENTGSEWTFKDQLGNPYGSASPNFNGGWTFYDRLGNPVGSQDGK